MTCVDRSGSVPDALIARTLKLTGDAAEALVVEDRAAAGTPATTIYMSLTGADSYSAQQPISPLHLKAIPPRTTNPSDSRARDAWKQDQLDPAVATAKAWAARVRDYRPPREGASDVWGCPVKAAELLGSAEERVLVIASDLEPFGRQNRARLDLAGVRVVVVFGCGAPRADAAECQRRRQTWDRRLATANAASVTWFDAQQVIDASDLLTHPTT